MGFRTTFLLPRREWVSEDCSLTPALCKFLLYQTVRRVLSAKLGFNNLRRANFPAFKGWKEMRFSVLATPLSTVFSTRPSLHSPRNAWFGFKKRAWLKLNYLQFFYNASLQSTATVTSLNMCAATHFGSSFAGLLCRAFRNHPVFTYYKDSQHRWSQLSLLSRITPSVLSGQDHDDIFLVLGQQLNHVLVDQKGKMHAAH